jgi:putative spermidine/putrescine transport system ATP-binding protein
MKRKTELSVLGVRKCYGSVVALEQIDLELQAGEFVTLLGPSGSGKSTLLMAVAGLIQPDSGNIWIDGKLITNTPVHERSVGMVFQNYALFPHMTVNENIGFPLEMRKVPKKDIALRVKESLAMVNLSEVGERFPKQLSGGQQQRIAIARAIVYEPSIILMDEPLGALDRRLRTQMQIEIKHLHKTLNATVLYVTHDQEEALSMSDRICLMNSGHIEQIGPADEIYFQPKNQFCATFLGDANLLPGEIISRDGLLKLNGLDENKIVGRINNDVTLGTKIFLVLRPECIQIDPEIEDQSLNRLQVKVIERLMQGSTTKLILETKNKQKLIAACLTNDKLSNLDSADITSIGWRPSDCCIIDRKC